MTAQELKNSVLQLAVQGKLVPQCKDDEPASELLKRIRAEKKKLGIKEKPLPEIKEEEMPFDIPDSWEWVKLGKICKIATGKKDANFGDENGEYYFFTCAKKPIRCKSFSFEGESILIAGNGDINNITYYDGQFEAYQRTYIIQPYIEHSYLYYLLFHIKSNWVKYNVDKMFGSAIPYIRLGNVQNYMVALPPLAEQKRIVEKIEELMPLIEEYGKAEEQLSKLNAEFPDKLRKSILQQTVQGKLTERDPADEPASELLKRIKAEKEALIKSGKIKKEKPLPAISNDEKPFDIPDTWEWVRLGSIADMSLGKMLDKSKNKGELQPYLRNVNVRWGEFDFSDILEMRFLDEEKERYSVQYGDLVVCEGGEPGRCAVWAKHDTSFRIQKALHRVRFYYGIDSFFAYRIFQIYASNGYFAHRFSGETIKHLPGVVLANIAFPLPPLSEQKRIVKRVEELLALCDELK